MTLEELDETLPNGLHDARIKALTHDYAEATVKLAVEIQSGLPDDSASEQWRTCLGEILFHGVQFCVVGAPENEQGIGRPGSLWFTFDRIEPGLLPDNIQRSIPLKALCYTLYILEWESQIHIAANSVSFAWADTREPATAQ
jgi:hypothetical protein